MMDVWGGKSSFVSMRLIGVATFCIAIFLGTFCEAEPKPDPTINYPALSIEKLTALAEKGDVVAQNRLGIRYALGNGVEKNLVTANQWYRRAAEAGNHWAQNNLGDNYLRGKGVKLNHAKARYFFTLAAKGGVAQAQNSLGTLYEKGLGTKSDMRQAAAWYKKAAEQNNATAQSNYAVCLIQGRGVKRNVAEGVAWLEKSAAKHDPRGLNNLGMVYAKGWIGKPDLAKAAELFKLAAAAGHQGALAKLQKLSDSGNAEGQFHLATLLENGAGVKQDRTAAQKLYQKAAQQDHTRAIAVLGLFFESGAGGKKDSKKAVELYKIASERGDAQAQNSLGKCYFNGSGIEKNVEQAASLFEKAAKQGYVEAFNNQAFLVENGLIKKKADGKPDLDLAATLYYQAAAKGHDVATKNLQRLADAGNDQAKSAVERLDGGSKTESPTAQTAENQADSDTDSKANPKTSPATVAQKEEISQPPSTTVSPKEKTPKTSPNTAAKNEETPIPSTDQTASSAPIENPAEELKALLKKYKAEELHETIDGLQAFVEKYPGSDIAWNLLGMALEDMDMFDEAEAAFDEAIGINPKSRQAYLGKAMLLQKQKRYHEAAETLEVAVKKNSNDQWLLRALWQVESQAKRYRDVVKYGERAWSKKKSDDLAFNLAIAYHFLGKKSERDEYIQETRDLGGNAEQLVTIFEKSDRIQKDKPKLLEWIKSIGQKGDLDRAIAQTIRYLNYDPNAVELWGALGQVYMEQKKYPEAVEMLRMANYLNEDELQYQHALAEALVESGKLEQAMDQYQKTIKQFPKMADTYGLAALIALKMNEPKLAVTLGKKAWALAPTDPTTAVRLAIVYHYVNDIEKRDEFHKKAEELGKVRLGKLSQMFKENRYEAELYYGNPVTIKKLLDGIKQNTNFLLENRIGISAEGGKFVATKNGGKKTMSPDAVLKENAWRYRQLERACRAYLKRYPKSYIAWNILGLLCKDRDDFEEALRCHDMALKFNEDFAGTYFAKGTLYMLLGQQTPAVECLTKALEKNPHLLDKKDLWVSEMLLMAKDYKSAAEISEILWAAHPKAGWIPAELVVAYHHLGEIEKRDKYLAHARRLGYKDIKTLEKMIAEEPPGEKK